MRKCRNEKSLSDPGAREVFVRQVPGLLLQLSRDRSDAARHPAPGPALRSRLRGGRRALHQARPGRQRAAATLPQGPDLRFGVRPARPGDAPLHRIRIASRGLPRVSRQRALRLLRLPEIRARAPGRSRVHRPDVGRALRAFSRIAESVAAGVMASGSMRSSRSAGLPEALARSNAGAKSSVRSTTSPCAPNARAYAAKSGFFSSVPNTRPGYSGAWCMRIVP